MRAELHPKGLEVVTVAMDTGGAEAARPWIEAARPEHPSLIDRAHVMGEMFGVVNVPTGIWIDEDGMIVRPPETAFARRFDWGRIKFPDDIDPYLRETLEEATKIKAGDSHRYLAALRDWMERGAESPYALPPDEVLRRSRPRPREAAEAAAHFELGQHLWRLGRADDAVPHFRQAHRLQPDNWTYKRQAWSFAHPFQGPTDLYDGDWVSDVRKVGAENYYDVADL